MRRLDGASTSSSTTSSSFAAPHRQQQARRGAASASAGVAARSGGVDRLTITAPDDWHLHLRDGDAMRAVVPHSAAHFRRAVVMPNLVPPVTTTDMVRWVVEAGGSTPGRGG